jgi:hypothetical protein
VATQTTIDYQQLHAQRRSHHRLRPICAQQ